MTLLNTTEDIFTHKNKNVKKEIQKNYKKENITKRIGN